MLACEVLADLGDEYLCMRESACFETIYMFCKEVVMVLSKDTLENEMLLTQPNSWLLEMQEGFLGCLKPSLHAFVMEKYPLVWQGDIKSMLESTQSYLKLWPYVVVDFESLSLA